MLVILTNCNNGDKYKLNLNESQLELLNYLNMQNITDLNVDIIKDSDFKRFGKENY